MVVLEWVVLEDPVPEFGALLITDSAGKTEMDADEHARSRVFFRGVRNAMECPRSHGRKHCRHGARESKCILITEKPGQNRSGCRAHAGMGRRIVRNRWCEQQRFPR